MSYAILLMSIKYISCVPSQKPEGIYCSFCYKELEAHTPDGISFPMGRQFQDFFPDSNIQAELRLLSCDSCCQNILQKTFLDRKISQDMTFHIVDL